MEHITVCSGITVFLGIEVSLMLGYLKYKDKYWGDFYRKKLDESYDGWFYQTVEDAKYMTGLSKYQQSKAVKILVENNMIKCEIKPIAKHKTVRFFFLKVLIIERTIKQLNEKLIEYRNNKEFSRAKENKRLKNFTTYQKQIQEVVKKLHHLSRSDKKTSPLKPEAVKKLNPTNNHAYKSLPINQEDFFKKKDFNKNKTSLLEKEQPMVAKNELTENEINDFVASL